MRRFSALLILSLVFAATPPASSAEALFDTASKGGGCSDPFVSSSPLGPVSHHCAHHETANVAGRFSTSIASRTRLEGRAHSVGSASSYVMFEKTFQAPAVPAVEVVVTIQLDNASRGGQRGALSLSDASVRADALLRMSAQCWWRGCSEGSDHEMILDADTESRSHDVIVLRGLVYDCAGNAGGAVGATVWIDSLGSHETSQGSFHAETHGAVTSVEMREAALPASCAGVS